MDNPKTLFDKIWDAHCVFQDEDGVDILAIDRVVLHERTGGVALKSLKQAGRQLADSARVFGVMDHIVSFRSGRGRNEVRVPGGEGFVTETREMAEWAGIQLIDTDDARQGIVHVVSPELGICLPGMTLICPDSHTCSLGALGLAAWGVGSSEAEHAMATGTLRAKKPPQMRVQIDGELRAGVSVKDLALHLIGEYGAAGGKRCAIEFCGDGVSRMSLEERLTLANLAVEFSAFTAVIAPDEKVIEYLRGRSYAPMGETWDRAVDAWSQLHTDAGTRFDHELRINAANVEPTVTWGTSPEHAIRLSGKVPEQASDEALRYMGLERGQSIAGQAIGGAFIGSCTNGRLSDLRSAAEVLRGAKIAPGVWAVCVPGSQAVKRAAEAEGLDQVFKDAGFEWGEPGCAMCFYAGGKTFEPGTRVISSTNRNFEGRQGPGVRTHLASPAVVAASAIAGCIAGAGVQT